MVSEQYSKENTSTNNSFDDRDLDRSVIEKSSKSADYEAKMIAEFNAKVNNLEQDKKSNAKKSDNNEQGGPSGLEPTRYGDWERKGRCYDF